MQLEMICVQPLSYPIDSFNGIMAKKINLARLVQLSHDRSGARSWLDSYDSTRSGAQSVYKINCGPAIDVELLRRDIALRCTGPKAELLARALDAMTVGCRLLFDIRFSYFILVYEFAFVLPRQEDLLLVCAYESNVEPKDDFYNELRSLLVQEENNSLLGDWAVASRSAALKAAERVLTECLTVPRAESSLIIPPSTGNISFLVSSMKEDERTIATPKLFDVNRHAERQTKSFEPLQLSDGTSFLFGGRFHTAILSRQRTAERIKLIQFHMQYMWFYLNRFNDQVDLINRILIDAEPNAKAQSLDGDLAPLVMKIELLRIHNERFKVAMEAEAENIYKPIQGRWNVEGALGANSHFLAFIRQHLEGVAEKRRSTRSAILNGLLAVISVLQILGLVSVWTDYLTITEHNDRMHPLFSDVGTLWSLNAFLPLCLLGLVLLISLMATAYARRND